jgi:hypothetical protein
MSEEEATRRATNQVDAAGFASVGRFDENLDGVARI